MELGQYEHRTGRFDDLKEPQKVEAWRDQYGNLHATEREARCFELRQETIEWLRRAVDWDQGIDGPAALADWLEVQESNLIEWLEKFDRAFRGS